jgi:rRNA maturation endonuclease Nob1
MSEDFKWKVTCTRCEVNYESDMILYFCPKCKLGGLIHDQQKEQEERMS